MSEDELKLPLDKYLLKRIEELEEKVVMLEDRIDIAHKHIIRLETSNSIHHGVYR